MDESPESMKSLASKALSHLRKLTFHLTKRPKKVNPGKNDSASTTKKSRNPLKIKDLREVRPTGFEPATFRVGV